MAVRLLESARVPMVVDVSPGWREIIGDAALLD